jgi:hypothetical protein
MRKCAACERECRYGLELPLFFCPACDEIDERLQGKEPSEHLRNWWAEHDGNGFLDTLMMRERIKAVQLKLALCPQCKQVHP